MFVVVLENTSFSKCMLQSFICITYVLNTTVSCVLLCYVIPHSCFGILN